MPNEGQILANSAFDFQFAGRIFRVQRASLRQVMEWQDKVFSTLKPNRVARDTDLIFPALYIALHTIDSSITEEYILDNCPGDIEVNDTLLLLGFVSQRKTDLLPKIKNVLVNQPSGDKSLQQ